MQFRLTTYDTVAGFVTIEAPNETEAIVAFGTLGFAFDGRCNVNPAQCTELQGPPKFAGLYGPMWDGAAIRYESSAAYEQLSI